MRFISGEQKVFHKLMRAKDAYLDGLADAVEQSAVVVANKAKENHEHGSDPHAMERFETQTGALVRSIKSELTTVGHNEVVAQTFSTMEYAPNVELGTSKTRAYPFLFPALAESQDDFKERVKKVL
jgi:HK97 gp10 family phage protein